MATPTRQLKQSPSLLPNHKSKPDLAHNQSQKPVTEFHLFSKLPLDIRQRICIFSLPGPRLISLIYTPPAITPQSSSIAQNKLSLFPQPPHMKHSTITSPTPLQHPSLIHVNRESRAFIHTLYQPCLPLSGLSKEQKDQQILYNPITDILHLPSLPGYNASWNNFTAIHTLTTPPALATIRRLAVSKDVFLEEEKKRWCIRHVDLAPNSDTRVRVVKGDGQNDGGGALKAHVDVKTDGVTVKNIEGFWDVVRRKFETVEEVWILGVGAENRILEADIDRCEDWMDGGSGDSGFECRDRWSRKRRLSFERKVESAVRMLEEVTDWTVPRWRVLGCEDEEEETSSLDVENEENEIGDGQREPYLHEQQVSLDFKTTIKDELQLVHEGCRYINE